MNTAEVLLIILFFAAGCTAIVNTWLVFMIINHMDENINELDQTGDQAE